MSYVIALKRLKAFKPKALLSYTNYEHGLCCAVSVAVPAFKKVDTSTGSLAAYIDNKSTYYARTHEALLEGLCLSVKESGLTIKQAMRLQDVNDSAPVNHLPHVIYRERARYKYVLNWLKAQVRKEKAAKARRREGKTNEL